MCSKAWRCPLPPEVEPLDAAAVVGAMLARLADPTADLPGEPAGADLTWLASERDYGRLRDNDDDADDWKRGQP